MWRQAFRQFLAPVDNRYYVGVKRNRRAAIAYVIPGLIIVAITILATRQLAYLWLGAGVIVLSVVDYILFDKISDWVSWNLVYKHFYQPHGATQSPLADAMKAYERDPSEANRQLLQQLTKENNNG